MAGGGSGRAHAEEGGGTSSAGRRARQTARPEARQDAEAIPLLVVVGPTAVGKTAVAVEAAKALDGEIVSADSMAVYRAMDIGTAKPTAKERRQARFHLIDHVAAGERYTVQQYQQDAEGAIVDIHRRGKVPLLCGGTGLYVSAVLDHYVFPPGGEDTGLREALEAEAERDGGAALHERLAQVDPMAAARIHPHNVRRVIRALEAHGLSGQPMSELQQVDAAPAVRYNPTVIGLTMPRKHLYVRIERRVDEMVAAGLLGEVRALREGGVPAQSQALQALGYRQLGRALDGELALSEAVRLVKRDTRRYAKRQLTWFKRDPRIVWLDVEHLGGAAAAAREVCHEFRRRLAGTVSGGR